MIEKRTTKKIHLGENLERYTVRLESPALSRETMHMKRKLVFDMLRDIYDNPALVACGQYDFEKLQIHFNGERWVIEAEAEIQRDEQAKI